MNKTGLYNKIAATVFSLISITAYGQQNNPAAAPADPRVEQLQAQDPISYQPDDITYTPEWPPLREDNILWKKRIWKTIDIRDKGNALLKGSDGRSLALVFAAGFGQNLFKAYSTKDDRFTYALSDVEFDVISASADAANITRYMLKEDWMYLAKEHKLISRIIGIAPLKQVIAPDGTTTEEPLYWLYYPATRKLLAQQQVGRSANGVQNLDQAFETRHFSGTITRISSPAKWHF